MNASHQKAFSRRKFISVGLFLTFTVLVITAIVIRIFEALENELFIHLFTEVHIFSGLAFSVLSVFHAKMNWQSIRVYVKAKQSVFSREAVCAFLLTVVTILAGVLVIFLTIKTKGRNEKDNSVINPNDFNYISAFGV